MCGACFNKLTHLRDYTEPWGEWSHADKKVQMVRVLDTVGMGFIQLSGFGDQPGYLRA